jgi:hypothetical protein
MANWYQQARFTPIGEAPIEPRRLSFQFTIRQLLITTAFLASVLGVAEWIRLERPWVVPDRENSAIVAICEKDAHSVLLEFRMRKPFTLVLRHCLQKRIKSPTITGVSIQIQNVEGVRSETVAIMPSTIGLLRGHIVRFRVTIGKEVTIQTNNETVSIALWLVDDVSNATWSAPREGDEIGCGGGRGIFQLATNNDSEEWIYLSVSSP